MRHSKVVLFCLIPIVMTLLVLVTGSGVIAQKALNYEFDFQSQQEEIILSGEVELDKSLRFALWEVEIFQNRTEQAPLSSISVSFETDKGGEELFFAGPWSEAVEECYSFSKTGNTTLPANFIEISVSAAVIFRTFRVDFVVDLNITALILSQINGTGELPADIGSPAPLLVIVCGIVSLSVASLLRSRPQS